MREIGRPRLGKLFQAATRFAGLVRVRIWSLRLASCGVGTFIDRDARIMVPGSVSLGARVSINAFVHIWGGGGVSIGDNTMLAAHVVVTSQSHDLDAAGTDTPYRDTTVHNSVRIGGNVFIGSSAVILPGVSIGNNAVIAAGSIVRKDVAANTLVAGVPARVIRLLS